VSRLPRELRDLVEKRYERALDERDRQISRAEGQVRSLRQMAAESEAALLHQRELVRGLESEIREGEREFDQERAQALERLGKLQRRAEEQHRRLTADLAEAERRHRKDWETLGQQIHQLQLTREDRERRTRQAAADALSRAAELGGEFDRAESERLDLQGNLAAAEIHLDSARALAADPKTPSAELLAATYGAEEALRQVAATLASRRALLAALSRQFLEEADWLAALLQGEPGLGLPDQAADLDRLLLPERKILLGVIERHLRFPAAGLARWNGHGALVARLAAVRDLTGTEILAARKALPGAVEHERERYELSPIWEDLELRFGSIRDRGAATPGAWADAADRKSTYFYYLESQRGELRVEVPWMADILVYFEGRLVQRYPPALAPNAGAGYVAGLSRRWQELALRLDNPNWTPDTTQGDLR